MPTSKRPLEHPQYQPHQHTHSSFKLERPLKTVAGSSVSRLQGKYLEMVDEEQRNVNQYAQALRVRVTANWLTRPASTIQAKVDRE